MLTSSNLISQSCDLINESNLVNKQLSPTNCSNNSSMIASTIKSSSAQSNVSDYLMGKKQQTPSVISSQPVTPQQFPISGNLNNMQPIAISPISSQIDNELLGQSTDELVYRIKTLEAKNRKLLFENDCLIKDINTNLANIQYSKHQILQLKKDNSELRDLCCYLDDERNRARQIASEWATFGNHLKKEINNYNRKLAQLESKQFELVKENYELKQLCLLLDKAITNSKTVDGKEIQKESDSNLESHLSNDKFEKIRSINKDEKSESIKRKSILNYKLINYIKLLEAKLDEFDDERKLFLNKLKTVTDASNQQKELENFEFKSESNLKDNLNDNSKDNLNYNLDDDLNENSNHNLNNKSNPNLRDSLIKSLINSLKNKNLKELKDKRPNELLDKAMELLDLEQSFEQENDEEMGKNEFNKFTNNQYSKQPFSKKVLKNKEFDESSLNGSLISKDQKLIIKKLCNAAYKKIEDE